MPTLRRCALASRAAPALRSPPRLRTLSGRLAPCARFRSRSSPLPSIGIETAIPAGSANKESAMPEQSTDQPGRPAKALTKSDLAHCTGTEQVYRHPLVPHIRYTDGVQYVASLGEAYWLLDKIACAQLEQRHAGQEFQLWTLTVSDDYSADLVCTDGNGTVVSAERIECTDFPLFEIKFYVTDNTILLPSEC